MARRDGWRCVEDGCSSEWQQRFGEQLMIREQGRGQAGGNWWWRWKEKWRRGAWFRSRMAEREKGREGLMLQQQGSLN
ncbi:hypothetical protein AMTR_s00050p00131290 [Amborella trichopoda]|uniref:Uncharacterized protein n=1 Tax=Amborella trichopoda TaxID=13333 RepID=W1PY70_AMBTC|nr:hypothetical protein AMTR_s00050p00131290 [Amborella trichopoda]